MQIQIHPYPGDNQTNGGGIRVEQTMKVAVVIVAGGRGNRMGAEIPKQFLEIGGVPVLMRTVRRFARCLPEAKLIVVLPADQIEYWQKLCCERNFGCVHTVVCGGENRFESVRNGLAEVDDCDYVGVHDGVRPFASDCVINGALEAAVRHGAAIPVVAVTDSLREVVDGGSCIVNREKFRAVQTPQFFERNILLDSYKTAYSEKFTDDASVVEAAGRSVALSEGDAINIKITTPVDMLTAEAICGRDV